MSNNEPRPSYNKDGNPGNPIDMNMDPIAVAQMCYGMLKDLQAQNEALEQKNAAILAESRSKEERREAERLQLTSMVNKLENMVQEKQTYDGEVPRSSKMVVTQHGVQPSQESYNMGPPPTDVEHMTSQPQMRVVQNVSQRMESLRLPLPVSPSNNFHSSRTIDEMSEVAPSECPSCSQNSIQVENLKSELKSEARHQLNALCEVREEFVKSMSREFELKKEVNIVTKVAEEKVFLLENVWSLEKEKMQKEMKRLESLFRIQESKLRAVESQPPSSSLPPQSPGLYGVQSHHMKQFHTGSPVISQYQQEDGYALSASSTAVPEQTRHGTFGRYFNHSHSPHYPRPLPSADGNYSQNGHPCGKDASLQDTTGPPVIFPDHFYHDRSNSPDRRLSSTQSHDGLPPRRLTRESDCITVGQIDRLVSPESLESPVPSTFSSHNVEGQLPVPHPFSSHYMEGQSPVQSPFSSHNFEEQLRYQYSGSIDDITQKLKDIQESHEPIQEGYRLEDHALGESNGLQPRPSYPSEYREQIHPPQGSFPSEVYPLETGNGEYSKKEQQEEHKVEHGGSIYTVESQDFLENAPSTGGSPAIEGSKIGELEDGKKKTDFLKSLWDLRQKSPRKKKTGESSNAVASPGSRAGPVLSTESHQMQTEIRTLRSEMEELCLEVQVLRAQVPRSQSITIPEKQTSFSTRISSSVVPESQQTSFTTRPPSFGPMDALQHPYFQNGERGSTQSSAIGPESTQGTQLPHFQSGEPESLVTRTGCLQQESSQHAHPPHFHDGEIGTSSTSAVADLTGQLNATALTKGSSSSTCLPDQSCWGPSSNNYWSPQPHTHQTPDGYVQSLHHDPYHRPPSGIDSTMSPSYIRLPSGLDSPLTPYHRPPSGTESPMTPQWFMSPSAVATPHDVPLSHNTEHSRSYRNEMHRTYSLDERSLSPIRGKNISKEAIRTRSPSPAPVGESGQPSKLEPLEPTKSELIQHSEDSTKLHEKEDSSKESLRKNFAWNDAVGNAIGALAAAARERCRALDATHAVSVDPHLPPHMSSPATVVSESEVVLHALENRSEPIPDPTSVYPNSLSSSLSSASRKKQEEDTNTSTTRAGSGRAIRSLASVLQRQSAEERQSEERASSSLNDDLDKSSDIESNLSTIWVTQPTYTRNLPSRSLAPSPTFGSSHLDGKEQSPESHATFIESSERLIRKYQQKDRSSRGEKEESTGVRSDHFDRLRSSNGKSQISWWQVDRIEPSERYKLDKSSLSQESTNTGHRTDPEVDTVDLSRSYDGDTTSTSYTGGKQNHNTIPGVPDRLIRGSPIVSGNKQHLLQQLQLEKLEETMEFSKGLTKTQMSLVEFQEYMSTQQTELQQKLDMLQYDEISEHCPYSPISEHISENGELLPWQLLEQKTQEKLKVLKEAANPNTMQEGQECEYISTLLERDLILSPQFHTAKLEENVNIEYPIPHQHQCQLHQQIQPCPAQQQQFHSQQQIIPNNMEQHTTGNIECAIQPKIIVQHCHDVQNCHDVHQGQKKETFTSQPHVSPEQFSPPSIASQTPQANYVDETNVSLSHHPQHRDAACKIISNQLQQLAPKPREVQESIQRIPQRPNTTNMDVTVENILPRRPMPETLPFDRTPEKIEEPISRFSRTNKRFEYPPGMSPLEGAGRPRHLTMDPTVAPAMGPRHLTMDPTVAPAMATGPGIIPETRQTSPSPIFSPRNRDPFSSLRPNAPTSSVAVVQSPRESPVGFRPRLVNELINRATGNGNVQEASAETTTATVTPKVNPDARNVETIDHSRPQRHKQKQNRGVPYNGVIFTPNLGIKDPAPPINLFPVNTNTTATQQAVPQPAPSSMPPEERTLDRIARDPLFYRRQHNDGVHTSIASERQSEESRCGRSAKRGESSSEGTARDDVGHGFVWPPPGKAQNLGRELNRLQRPTSNDTSNPRVASADSRTQSSVSSPRVGIGGPRGPRTKGAPPPPVHQSNLYQSMYLHSGTVYESTGCFGPPPVQLTPIGTQSDGEQSHSSIGLPNQGISLAQPVSLETCDQPRTRRSVPSQPLATQAATGYANQSPPGLPMVAPTGYASSGYAPSEGSAHVKQTPATPLQRKVHCARF